MSQAPSSPGLLGLVALFSHIASTVLFRALTYPLRANRASTFKKDVFFAALRTWLHRATIPQMRYLIPGTTQRYLDFCSQRKAIPATLYVDYINANGTKSNVQAHWIGSKDADIMVLYLHGGGYTQPATQGYMHYWRNMIEDFKLEGKTKTFAVLLLAYTLAPEARYPTQLQEASAVLSHLLHARGRSASSIIISADSAGGNLALSLLSHLLHPHPKLSPVELSTPLAGALLFSPWGSFSTDSDSFVRNAEKDMLHPVMLRRWAAMFLGKSKDDPESDPGPVCGDLYTDPLTNDTTWWAGMHRIVSDVCIWSGSHEMLVDQIRSFGQVFKNGWSQGGGETGRIVLVESLRRAHIEPIMGVMMEPGTKGEHQLVVEEWLSSRLVL